MDNIQEVDVQRIMEQIKEKLGKRRQESSPMDISPPPVDGQILTDLSALHSGHDIYRINFSSHRKILGSLVIALKKIVLQLLTPSLERQVAYNAANARVATSLKDYLSSMEQRQGQWRREIVASQAEALYPIRQEMENLQQQQGQWREEILAAQAEALHGIRQRVDVSGLQQGQALQAVRREIENLQQQGEALQAVRQEMENLQQQGEALQAVRQEMENLQQQQGQWREEILAAQAEVLHPLREKIEGMNREHSQVLQMMRERASRTEGRLRRIYHALSNGRDEEEPVKIERKPVPLQALTPAFDALEFGERFWGSEVDLKERRRIYVDYFRGSDEVLDIGCGRGEFLELLQGEGIKSKGLDIDLDMILLCQEKGLDVIREDGLVYLESLPDTSLGGVFAAQVVEHLEPNQIIELVNLCIASCAGGGC